MGKGLIIFIIITLLALAGLGAFLIYNNSDTSQRASIEKGYYEEFLVESNNCETDEFDNKDICFGIIRCASHNAAELIPEDGLKNVLDTAKKSNDYEDSIFNYLSSIGFSHSELERAVFDICLEPYGLNESGP